MSLTDNWLLQSSWVVKEDGDVISSAGFVPDLRAEASSLANCCSLARIAALATCRISGLLR